MENVTQALKMAAAVLLFSVSLAIAIGSFGQTRQSAELAFQQIDRDFDSDTYLEETTETNREVGLETIVPSIYKAYKENYKIVFEVSGNEISDNRFISKKRCQWSDRKNLFN